MNATSYNESEPRLARVLGKRALVYLGILVFAFALLLILNTGNASAAGSTYIGSDITDDTTWEADESPYIVTTDIEIKNESTLTIEPNVTVMFNSAAGIDVNDGTLDAQGTTGEPITFTSNGSTTWGYWDGIEFWDASTDSIMDNVVIEYPNTALDLSDTELQLSNAEISYVSNVAVNVFSTDQDADMALENVVINGTWGDAIFVYSANDDANLELLNVEITNAGSTGVELNANTGTSDLLVDGLYIDDAGSHGIYLWASDSVNVDILDAWINDTWLQGIYMYAGAGDLTFAAESLDITNIEWYGIQGWANQTIDFDITDYLLDNITYWTDTVRLSNMHGDIDVSSTDGWINDTDNHGFDLYADNGSISVDLTNTDMTNLDGTGLIAVAPLGDVDVAVDPSLIDECLGVGIDIHSGGSVDFLMENSVISNADSSGVTIYAELDVNVVLTNATLDTNGNNGLFVDANEGNVTLAMTGGMVNGTSDVGIDLYTFNGTIEAEFYQTSFSFNEMSIVAETDNFDVDLVIDECTFTGDYYGSIMVNAGGDSNFELTDNVMNGFEANAEGWYFFDEIDYEYDLIAPESGNWTSADSMFVPLPFEFPYAGGTYTGVMMYEDGYIEVGGNDVVPCSEDFETSLYPWYGYKAYDDRVVFQWDVFVVNESSNLRNVFEVIFYDTGDIQFNYAEMESLSHDVNPYGLEVGSTFINVGEIWDTPDPFDNDWTSYYFTYAPMSYGKAAGVYSFGNNTAWVYNNTISNYYAGGVECTAEEGWAWMDAVNNSLSKMVAMEPALMSTSMNNTIYGNAQENDLSEIVLFGIAFVSEPTLGGTDEVVITNNSFTDVGFVPIASVSEVWDEWETTDIEYTKTTTIADNIGVNSGMIWSITEIGVETSTWNVTNTDLITRNHFTGYPKVYIMPFIGETPLPGMMDTGTITSTLYLDTEANATAVHDVDITDNEHVALNIEYEAGSDGIVVVDEVRGTDDAIVEWSTDISIVGNSLTAAEWTSFDNGILADASGTVGIGADMTMDAIIDIYDNTVQCTGEGGYTGISVDADLRSTTPFYDGDTPQASGSMNADVFIWENVVLNFDYGIDFDYDTYLYNFWGDFESTVDTLITGNEIVTTDTGIEGDLDAQCRFYSYVPPFEEEIWSSVNAEYTTIISSNDISSSYYGIDIDPDADAHEDYYGTFANANCVMENDLVINGNTIESGDDGIYLYIDNDARGGEANATVTTTVNIYDNTLVGMEGGPTASGDGIDIREYSEAWAQTLDIDDSPVLVTNLRVSVNDNQISGYYDGVRIRPDVETSYGLSYVNAAIDIDVLNNNITVSDDGIYVYLDEYDYQSTDTNATADVTATIMINDNVITAMTGEGEPLWMDDGIYVSADSSSAITDEVMVWIQDNTLDGVGESNDGIFVDGNDANASFVITNNVIDLFDTGIRAYDGSMEITDNTVSDAMYEGIYAYNAWGVVSDNTFTGCYYGMDLYQVYDMVVSDNDVTGVGYTGIYASMAVNTTIESNMVDGYERDMALYTCLDSLVSMNTLTNSASYALYADDCIGVEISNNTMQDGLNDGLYMRDGVDVIVADNTISNFMSDGIMVYSTNGCMIMDNTVFDVMEDGLDISSSYDVELYNGIFYDCADYAIYGSSYSMIWYIDDIAEVRNCPVYFEGDVIVQDGGWLNTDFVSQFVVADDYYDGVPAITVEEGGVLTATNTVFGGSMYCANGYAWVFDVYGTMEMDNSWVYGAYQLYIGPTSDVAIYASTISYNELNGVYVDDSQPTLASVDISYNNGAGVFITGESADPVIKDCIIQFNERGIYAYQTSIGQVIDNLIISNSMAGIYAEEMTGSIHDNILLLNQREIFLLNADVTIEDNQIGYSTLVDTMAEYWPLIMSEMTGPIESWSFEPEDIMSMMINHIGVYAEDSTVECSDNVYGMLSYALYAVRSDVTFMDDVRMNTLVLQYFDEAYQMYNISLPIFVYDGVFASDSTIDVVNAHIDVLDDALFLENTTATVSSCAFNAEDFDIYAMDDSMVNVTGTSVDKVKAEDSSIIDMYAILTVNTVDRDGNPTTVYLMVFDSVHTYPIAEGNSSESGTFTATVLAAEWNSLGKDTSVNSYTVVAHFDAENAEESVTVDGPTEVTLQEPGEPTITTGIVGAAAITIILGAILVVALISVASKP